MMLAAFEALMDGVPPAWVRKIEAAAMLGVFAHAFEVEAPATEGLSADEALAAFKEFTAACMEVALADARLADTYRARLGRDACALGRKVRRALGVRPSGAMRVARFFYRGIGIELSGQLPGSLRFGPCSFSRVYAPACCWFMSAFDEGFLRGLAGRDDASLVFESRITQGAPSCCARFA